MKTCVTVAPTPDLGGSDRGWVAVRGFRAAFALGIAAAMLASPAAADLYRDKALKRAAAAKREHAEKLPRGPLHVVVSIGSQSVLLYANGVFVARSAVSTGMHGHPTPTGVFTVIQKHKWHRSNIYSLAPMPYMQRITWSGVALHAGVLPGYPASHGCIRLTYEFATKLWGATRIGARVIVAGSEVAPVEIAHAHLFLPKPKQPEPPPAIAGRMSAALEPAVPERSAAIQQADASNGGAAGLIVVDRDNAIKPDNAIKGGISPMAAAPALPRKTGLVSAFVSRKAGKLFVRQGNEPLFDAPVTIRQPERPLGTHVFTAMEVKDDGAVMRWTVVTMPGELHDKAERADRRGKKKSRAKTDANAPPEMPLPQLAAEALDRIEMPKDAVDRIAEILTPGASLIVSDQGISQETGSDTDFIILTR